MIIISPILDSYYKFRLKTYSYRKQVYLDSLAQKLRTSKLGEILLRNLNDVMNKNPSYHKEFESLLEGKNYQEVFWESDLGYLWYKGNLKAQNDYFNYTLSEIKKYGYESHLDLGCGWGELSAKAIEIPTIKRSLGIDISQRIIDEAKANHSSSKAEYECASLDEITDQFDLVTVFGSADYIKPEDFQAALNKLIHTARKRVIIVNSLRNIPFDEVLKMTHAIEVMRYDVGYVQPIKCFLEKMAATNKFTYTIEKAGSDSSLTNIYIN